MKCSTNRCRPNVFEEIDRGLNQLMRGVLASDSVASNDPRMTVFEFDDRYVFECDLPGVALDAISLEIEDKVLSISGTRAGVTSAENAKIVLDERSNAEFSRKIRLSRDVDQSSVDAELKDGVLKISISKRSESQPRKVEIKLASG